MKFLILISLLSLSVFAKELIITNTSFIRVEISHQFQALLKNDDGTSTNVTNQTNFFVSGARETSKGQFYFQLPRHSRGNPYAANLRVVFQDKDNKTYTKSYNLRVDTTPDYINITGPFYVRSGGFYHFSAYGVFAGRSINLGSQGFWRAFRGQAFGTGQYRAPIIRGRGNIIDSIYFRFGRLQASKTITVAR